MKHRGRAHEFALYIEQFPHEEVAVGQTITLEDVSLVHRISRVLRLDKEDTVFLFTKQMHVVAVIQKIDKRQVILSVITCAKNILLHPAITLYLPLLKREALEQAVYSAVELGVTIIQLIKTEKVQRSWNEHELKRLQLIMIAAAEQSKSFMLPTLLLPIVLHDIQLHGTALFFDPQGDPIFNVIKDLKNGSTHVFSVIVGPEGDLSESEKYFLQQKGVIFTRLTPTILRSQQAVAVAVGLVRSIFSIS